MDPLNCELLFASYIKNHLGKCNRSYTNHWSLHYIIDAHARLSIADQTYELTGSWLWAGYPGPHFYQDPGTPLPRGHYRAALRGDSLEQWLQQELWPLQPLPISNVADMSKAFEYLLQQLQGSTSLHRRKRAHAVEGILLEAWSQQEQAPQQDLWLARCCALLDAEIANPHIDYERIASALYIPLSTLRRRFRQAMGQAMHRYVLEKRCRRAQDLLLSSGENLETIAAELGYEDVAYFSRQFKQLCGQSPSSFRQHRYY